MLRDGAHIATMVGVFIAVLALGYTAVQVKRGANANKAEFWLRFREMISHYEVVHSNLRPGGAWADPETGPQKPGEWVQVEGYMGLFEHCEIMMESCLIDRKTFKAIYRYRLKNILTNKAIVQKKLVDEKESWKFFLKLVEKERLSNYLPKGEAD